MLGLLLPAHQDATKAVHPAVASLHDPAASPLARLTRQLLRLFTPRANVGGEAELSQDLSHLIIVVAFVQAHPLGLLLAGLGSLNHNTLNRGPHQLHVVTIRAVDRQSYRNSIALSQQTAFDAVFAAVGRVWPRLFPPQGALWSSPHPYLARTSQCLLAHRSVRGRLATASETLPLRPSRRSGRGRWTWRTTRSGSRPPTGHRFAVHRRWHQHTLGLEPVADHHQSDGCLPEREAAAPVRPKGHLKFETRSSSCCSGYERACASSVSLCSYLAVYQLFG